MWLLVPFDARDPKSRLAGVLDPAERHAFAECLLRDVLETLADAGHEPDVLATAPIECPTPGSVRVDERPLTPAVNAVLEETFAETAGGDDSTEHDRTGPTAVAVVMADLALLTTEALDRLFVPDADVVIAPGLGGGTNALVVRHPGFRVDYHGVSYRDHLERARACGATVATVDSFRLACDVDDPSDLLEVALHSDGRAAEWLRDAGFEPDDSGGTPSIRR